MKAIDLNCDLGEAFGNYPMPNDILLMDYITSVNIACGFHAGDPSVMHQTVKLAIDKKLAIGAHPGLPDLQGFGRREMKVTPNEVYQITLYQIGALYAFVKAGNGNLNHVKAHGALYNMAAKDSALAKAFITAVHDFDSSLLIYGLAGSEMIKSANQIGLVVVSEFFADRTYQNDGSLTPRSETNAMIDGEVDAIHQVLLMVNEQKVMSTTKQLIDLKAETLCLHGDGPHALPFAKRISEELKKNGIAIKAPSK